MTAWSRYTLFLASAAYLIGKQVQAVPGKVRVDASAQGVKHQGLGADHAARGLDQLLRAIDFIGAAARRSSVLS